MSEILRTKSLDNKCKAKRYSHSLNKEARRRELDRITRENQVGCD
jgi:hypothetical protein